MSDLADLILAAEVAGIDAQPVNAAFQRGQGEMVIEVDVGDDGDRGVGGDAGEGFRRLHIGNGEADDLAPGQSQAFDLGAGGRDVTGVGLGHGLDRDGGPAADGNVAQADGAAVTPRGKSGCSGGRVLVCHGVRGPPIRT